MSQPATTVREIFARIECGMAGSREAGQLKAFIENLVFELGYSDTQSWQQCRFCHHQRGEGHADWCPAREVA